MPEYDMIIRNGTIVDGTGGPSSYRGDIAVKNGKIAMMSGRIKASANEELDATGCIVAPGAIDLHCHYDLQLNFDPYATMSGWHGVTSVAIGQCGFGFAPCKPEDREAAMRLMTRIEAVPYRSMELGLRWDWETFPQWLDSLDSHPLGVNVASLVAHNPLRLWVMGVDDARERIQPTDEEIKEMQSIFYDAMKAGAFGFSAARSLINLPEDGRFIPSQVASNEEFLALAEVLSEFGVGSIGWTRGNAERPLPPGEPDLIAGEVGPSSVGGGLVAQAVEGDARGKGREDFLIQLCLTSGRPMQWGLIAQSEANPTRYKDQLAFLERARAEGANMFAQTSSFFTTPVYELSEFNGFDGMRNWIDPFVGTPEERIAKLNTPGVRELMMKDLEVDMGTPGLPTAKGGADWTKISVVEVRHPRNEQYEGKTVEEVAKMTGKHPMDAMLDLALDEDLRTVFASAPSAGTDPVAMAEVLNHPLTHPCVSDGGAHIKYETIGTWPVHLLTTWVRERQTVALEKAHYKMSGLPAFITGMTDRGILKEGFAADIIVYDQEKLGFLHDKVVYDNDFPGDEKRIIQKAVGIRYTVVNGVVTFTEGTVGTGATPGKLLRSYEMVNR